MAKTLKRRVQRLEAEVASLSQKVQALERTATKKVPRRRAKPAGASATRKVKPAVVKPTLTSPSASEPRSGTG
jgi:hypothetical protein